MQDSPSTRAQALARLAAALLLAAGSSAQAQDPCAPAAEWTVPGSGRIAAPQILARAAEAQIVLLGESHDSADDHRWELQTVAALAGLHPKFALGFEMFPRRVQPALDRWVAGGLNEPDFLAQSDWAKVWGYDPEMYLPLFHFARLNRVPMLALNVERDFVHQVRAHGLASVPADRREGVSDPAAPSAAYLARLFDAYSQHPDEKGATPQRSDPGFQRFVQAQLVWDRAMAQALADAAARMPGALVVGIMGARHVAYGDGVAHQLESLGVKRIATLLPWDADASCKDFSAQLATGVFGLPAMPPAPPAPPPQLLGVQIDQVAEGVRVVAVSPGSVAEAAGLHAQDVLTEAAGKAVKTPGELKAIVVRTQPGTWLPLKAKRGGEALEFTAKFPSGK